AILAGHEPGGDGRDNSASCSAAADAGPWHPGGRGGPVGRRAIRHPSHQEGSGSLRRHGSETPASASGERHRARAGAADGRGGARARLRRAAPAPLVCAPDCQAPQDGRAFAADHASDHASGRGLAVAVQGAGAARVVLVAPLRLPLQRRRDDARSRLCDRKRLRLDWQDGPVDERGGGRAVDAGVEASVAPLLLRRDHPLPRRALAPGLHGAAEATRVRDAQGAQPDVWAGRALGADDADGPHRRQPRAGGARRADLEADPQPAGHRVGPAACARDAGDDAGGRRRQVGHAARAARDAHPHATRQADRRAASKPGGAAGGAGSGAPRAAQAGRGCGGAQAVEPAVPALADARASGSHRAAARAVRLPAGGGHLALRLPACRLAARRRGRRRRRCAAGVLGAASVVAPVARRCVGGRKVGGGGGGGGRGGGELSLRLPLPPFLARALPPPPPSLPPSPLFSSFPLSLSSPLSPPSDLLFGGLAGSTRPRSAEAAAETATARELPREFPRPS
ncbi:hypothetical protein EMIHUDRAFT_457205, partial [Emiliania huxleyi CCMP1516]|uniref:Uncharacterized protein n=2 Tax=Emiliania huxleyi TaxID=2903 RepID=A0A0D3JUV6_EMIH1